MSSSNNPISELVGLPSKASYATLYITQLSLNKCITPIISLLNPETVCITLAHNAFDSSFDKVPKSPVDVLLLAFLA